ncbi:MAG: beta-galactosidase [Candidatus Dormibacteraeota bacterium]|uniref:Beta-galactosidase n=1 Tax=Candidatus Dormiibacter inghamiae TaxID=3127013 RepID=A0A934NB05_9BACT|nr:beta-galactosidase [Candidatus Dormibacteraeota bacterium]MBJ7606967.1 beta-galactosidase [Candidatus Dormibacteraeota bacterium]
MRTRSAIAASVMGALTVAVASEVRIRRPDQSLTDRWRALPIEPRGLTQLGISFRPRQAEAMGLDPAVSLRTLLAYPFQLVRLGAYWDRLEPDAGSFDPTDLDWQVDAAETAGKQMIVCVGAPKNFGYPEFYAPLHHLPQPLREGSLIGPASHAELLAAATSFVTRVVQRYRGQESIVAWQVEHEAVDPLGMEHSWRLAVDFVEREVSAVRRADPTRPVLLNGFLPTSLPVRIQQWWRTRDQGDSLALAARSADIVGIDYYPRHALVGLGHLTAYLDGDSSPWRRRFAASSEDRGRRLMITEGQAEPWEAVTAPPNPVARAMYSCPPERLIENYNRCLRRASWHGLRLEGYLFWGAEYWLLRSLSGDSSYLDAFARIVGAPVSTE